MAPLDRNFVTRVALIGVLICIFTTDSTIACSKDFTTCRYDCLDEVVQEHCTSENAGHCAVDGKCCPGFFRTKNSCQICPDVHFMHDVNNCCECLPCSECDDVKNNTIETRCSHTTDTACKIPDDPPPRAPSACPWIESTSTSTSQVPTTQVPTTDTEESTVDTPSDPQRSKSEGTVNVYMVVFFILVGVLLLICVFLCYAHHSGGNDQVDVGKDRTWKDVAGIVAEKIRRTCAACRTCPPGGQPATTLGGQSASTPVRQLGGGGQSATTPVGQPGGGGQSATTSGGQPGGGGQSATTPVGQPGGGGQSATTPVRQPGGVGQSATTSGGQPGGGGQSATTPGDQPGGGGQEKEDANHCNNVGRDETDERSLLLLQQDGNQETDRKQRTVCDKCQQVINQEDATVKNGGNKEVDDPDEHGETDPLKADDAQ